MTIITSQSSPALHGADTTAEASARRSPWKPIARFKGSDDDIVTLWLSWGASPLTMGWGDAFAVAGCWRQNGKWGHLYRGKLAELTADYITHWAPADATLTAGPRGARLDWWQG